MPLPRAWLSCLFALSALGTVAAANPASTSAESAGAGLPASRVIHVFDFDERPEGNLEDIPKFWVAVRPRGFPQFAGGGFDFEVGKSAAPSFYLACNGRNVAYQYTGPATRVRPDSAYRIEGHLRPDRLVFARACLSAHYLDKHGEPLLETAVRSHYVSGAGTGAEAWIGVDVELPPAPPAALTVGLMVWILQEPNWNPEPPPDWHIPRVDVPGGAWLDDIAVYALPRAELTTSAPGNVLPPDRTDFLNVVLSDFDEADLVGYLSIAAPGGDVIETRKIVPEFGASAQPASIPLSHLRPGFYQARLDVRSGARRVVTRYLNFARLAESRRGGTHPARSFGVVIRPESRGEIDDELALLTNQQVGSVKVPVWTGLADASGPTRETGSSDRFLQDLLRNGMTLTGVFFGPPSAIVRHDGAFPRPLLELLNDPVEVWQDYLADVVARYASVFHWWQVGCCAEDAPVEAVELATAVGRLREVMQRFISIPRLGIPASGRIELPRQKWPVEEVTLSVGHEISPDTLDARIEDLRSLDYEHAAVHVEALPADRYERTLRLADFARRIITARFAGADTVFVPQAWQTRDTARGPITEPTEEYLIVRTIADCIGDARPGQRLAIAPGVEALAFHDGDRTTIALWDSLAPSEGRTHALQLGSVAEAVDLRGRAQALSRDADGRHLLRLGPAPIFVGDVDRWLIDFRSSVSLTPNRIESGTELAQHTVELAYAGPGPLTGSLYFEAPEGWEISPRVHPLHVTPGQSTRRTVEIRYPHNVVAGRRNILARISLGDGAYLFEVPLAVEVGLEGVQVSGMAVIERGDLVVQQVVTNLTDTTLHFRGAAHVPGRQRQYRPLYNLRPGTTQQVEYRFLDAANLAGTTVRVGLREMNDGPRVHTLELLVP